MVSFRIGDKDMRKCWLTLVVACCISAFCWGQVNPSVAGRSKVLLKTAKWGQGRPFNFKCPMYDGQYTITGCEATALAIIMQYYGYPDYGYGTTAAYTTPLHGLTVEERNLEHLYDWNLPTEVNGFASASYEENDIVSTIMADIGAAINADYDTECTDAYIRYWFPALTRHFDYHLGGMQLRDFKEWDEENECYTRWTDEEWLAMIEDELDKGHPVLYHATLPRVGMHVFVIDGYTDKHYLHVNMGWGGGSDGYYALEDIGGDEPWSYMWLGLVPMPYADEDMRFSIGERECVTMSEALGIAAISDGVPVKMLCDGEMETLTERNVAMFGGDDRPQPPITSCLDLNGHQLSAVDGYSYTAMEGNRPYFHRITDTEGTGSLYIADAIVSYEENATMEFDNIRIEGGTKREYNIFFFMNGGHLKLHDVTINKFNDGECFLLDESAVMELEDVRIKASELLCTCSNFTGSVICRSGLFSMPVDEKYLAEGSICELNPDEATRAEYPYRVVSPTGINGTKGNARPVAPIKRVQGQRVVIQQDGILFDANGGRIR